MRSTRAHEAVAELGSFGKKQIRPTYTRPLMKRSHHIKIIVAAAITVTNLSAAVFYISPQPYLAFNNPAAGTAVSPFKDISFNYFHLEDFEDGTLNTPGVTLAEGVSTIPPTSTYSDSVDGDDGVIDGIATNVLSLFSNLTNSSFTFFFSKTVLGTLPTHAGIVWTDIGTNFGGEPFSSDLVDNVFFEAFGPTGASLGVLGPYSLGDTSTSQTTGEDRFIGVIDTNGISAIKLSMPGKNNWEADHLQYGSVIPEPSSFCLTFAGLCYFL